MQTHMGIQRKDNGRIPTDIRYAGLFYDQQDGLYLADKRTYNPISGRWLNRDPQNFVAQANDYDYASSAPL